jgi:hypothetical protein
MPRNSCRCTYRVQTQRKQQIEEKVYRKAIHAAIFNEPVLGLEYRLLGEESGKQSGYCLTLRSPKKLRARIKEVARASK